MDYPTFESQARRVFAEIPPRFRQGVDGLEVSRATVPHPSLPDVYVLGECLTETYPTEFGGAGEVRSIVALYYGSFVELSRIDESFDWGEEIFETVTHEVRHHLESLADEDELEELDYAEDQNFARREGEPFDPLFYRAGEPAGEGAWRVDGDLFLEVEVERGTPPGTLLQVRHGGRTFPVPLPAEPADAYFVSVEEAEAGDTIAVLLPRRSAWDLLSGLWRRRHPRVVQVGHPPSDKR